MRLKTFLFKDRPPRCISEATATKKSFPHGQKTK